MISGVSTRNFLQENSTRNFLQENSYTVNIEKIHTKKYTIKKNGFASNMKDIDGNGFASMKNKILPPKKMVLLISNMKDIIRVVF